MVRRLHVALPVRRRGGLQCDACPGPRPLQGRRSILPPAAANCRHGSKLLHSTQVQVDVAAVLWGRLACTAPQDGQCRRLPPRHSLQPPAQAPHAPAAAGRRDTQRTSQGCARLVLAGGLALRQRRPERCSQAPASTGVVCSATQPRQLGQALTAQRGSGVLRHGHCELQRPRHLGTVRGQGGGHHLPHAGHVRHQP